MKLMLLYNDTLLEIIFPAHIDLYLYEIDFMVEYSVSCGAGGQIDSWLPGLDLNNDSNTCFHSNGVSSHSACAANGPRVMEGLSKKS